jgi:hypothetical protein
MTDSLEDGRLTSRPEVGGGPDGRALPVGGWREKEKGGGARWAGGRVSWAASARSRERRPTAWIGLAG